MKSYAIVPRFGISENGAETTERTHHWIWLVSEAPVNATILETSSGPLARSDNIGRWGRWKPAGVDIRQSDMARVKQFRISAGEFFHTMSPSSNKGVFGDPFLGLGSLPGRFLQVLFDNTWKTSRRKSNTSKIRKSFTPIRRYLSNHIITLAQDLRRQLPDLWTSGNLTWK